MGGNGGFDGKGGALVTGPFTLDGGWVVNTALHRNAWFTRGPNGTTSKDPTTGSWVVQPSLGRSVVRYLGDFEDLATPADIIEFTKRRHMFGPERLVYRSDLIPVNPEDDSSPLTALPMPRGTIYIGDSTLPLSALPKDSWIKNRHNLLRSKPQGDDDNPMKDIGDTDRSFRMMLLAADCSLLLTMVLCFVHQVRMFKVSDGQSKPRLTCIIVSILTSVVEYSHLIWTLETHDWFGFHTTILQDDEITGASTMPNVGCATADPIFFMHHCNIDRLWAEWQDEGHYGSM